ncbi:MAG TPA: protein kinase [Polyangiaceae bacterium]|nr:protein kinase [Polyangiaceae bacterium]
MPMAERYPEAEVVLDDELLFDDSPRRSSLLRRDERPEDIVREGEVLAGKYRVERIPGRNGLGVLVQVRHMELGQEVTLKFLVPQACAYPEFVQRFVREARAAVRIQGEHVARVTDVGRLESGAPYMVREFLRGPDLAEVLKVRGPLPIAEAVDYIIQTCEGVAEGHALGVVHRNLRPTSLIVGRRSDGTALVKVFDFAASESLHVNPFTERAVSLVGTSAIMASLPYLSPEQIRDPHDVDFRADVYSLGAVLYELLTGSAVYAADAAPALLAQVAADAAPAVRNLRPDCPGELDHIVLRCLAKNRGIRYASVADLAVALEPFASTETASSIERIVRLGKRTSKLPERAEERLPSPLPPAPVASVAPQSPPARGPRGTLLMGESLAAPSAPPSQNTVHDDVTTINPYAGYAAPVVIAPEPLRASSRPATYTQPIPHTQAIPQTQPLPASVPARPSVPPPLRTPVPPPLRVSAPAPVVVPSPAAAAAAATLPAAATPVSEMPPTRPDTTSLPPPRSSMSGLTRSWAVAEEPAKRIFTQRRLIAVGAMAACATLGAVLALRTARPASVAAAAPPAAAPARLEPPPPAPAPAPPPAEVAPAASAAPSVAPAPAAPTPAPAPVAAAPAPAPVAVAAPRPQAAPAAAPVVRRTSAKPREEAATEATPRKAATEKVASARPTAGGDLFDDPR